MIKQLVIYLKTASSKIKIKLEKINKIDLKTAFYFVQTLRDIIFCVIDAKDV